MLRNGKVRTSRVVDNPDVGQSNELLDSPSGNNSPLSPVPTEASLRPSTNPPGELKAPSSVVDKVAGELQAPLELPGGFPSAEIEPAAIGDPYDRYTKDEDGFMRPRREAHAMDGVSDDSTSAQSQISGPKYFPASFADSDEEDYESAIGDDVLDKSIRELTVDQIETYARRIRKARESIKRGNRKSKSPKAKKHVGDEPKALPFAQQIAAASVVFEDAPEAGPSDYLRKGKIRGSLLEGTDVAQYDKDEELAMQLHAEELRRAEELMELERDKDLKKRLRKEAKEDKRAKDRRSRSPRDNKRAVKNDRAVKQSKRAVEHDRRERSRSKGPKSLYDIRRNIGSHQRESIQPEGETVTVEAEADQVMIPEGIVAKLFGKDWRKRADARGTPPSKVKEPKHKNSKKREKRREDGKSSKSDKNEGAPKKRPRKTSEPSDDSASTSSSEPSAGEPDGAGHGDPSGDDSSSGSDSDSGSGGTNGSSPSDSSSDSSSDESPSETESSTDSDDGHRTKKRKKNHKASRGGKRNPSKQKRSLKFPEPTPYDGSPNITKFETYAYEAINYLEALNLPKKLHLPALKKTLTGTAGDHFMDTAATNPHKYKNVESYLMDLYIHCFPPYQLQKMREIFNRTNQGNKSVRDFLRDLRKWASRVPDLAVSEMAVRQQFWKGAAPYIKIEWAKAGMNAETHKLVELEKMALRYETAELYSQQLSRNADSHDGRRESRKEKRDRSKLNGTRAGPSRGRNSDHKNLNRDNGQTGKDERQKGFKTKYSKRGFKGRFDKDKRPKGDGKSNSAPKLSKDEMDTLRAAGKCFICKETGHMAKDCPKNNTAPRPSVGLSSVQIIELDRAVEDQRAQDQLLSASMNPNYGLRSLNPVQRRIYEAESNRLRLVRQLMLQEPFFGDEYLPDLENGEDRWLVEVAHQGAEYRVFDVKANATCWHIPVNIFLEQMDLHGVFGGHLKLQREHAFLEGNVNNDAVMAKMMKLFEDELNDHQSSIDDEREGARMKGRWITAPGDHDNEIVIHDRHPDPDEFNTIDGRFIFNRYMLLEEASKPIFSIVTWLYNERWERRKMMTEFRSAVPFPSDPRVQNASGSPTSRNRWEIAQPTWDIYYIRDLYSEEDFTLWRGHVLQAEGNFDYAQWMRNRQIERQGIEYDPADYGDDDDGDDDDDEDHHHHDEGWGEGNAPTWSVQTQQEPASESGNQQQAEGSSSWGPTTGWLFKFDNWLSARWRASYKSMQRGCNCIRDIPETGPMIAPGEVPFAVRPWYMPDGSKPYPRPNLLERDRGEDYTDYHSSDDEDEPREGEGWLDWEYKLPGAWTDKIQGDIWMRDSCYYNTYHEMKRRAEADAEAKRNARADRVRDWVTYCQHGGMPYELSNEERSLLGLHPNLEDPGEPEHNDSPREYDYETDSTGSSEPDMTPMRDEDIPDDIEEVKWRVAEDIARAEEAKRRARPRVEIEDAPEEEGDSFAKYDLYGDKVSEFRVEGETQRRSEVSTAEVALSAVPDISFEGELKGAPSVSSCASGVTVPKANKRKNVIDRLERNSAKTRDFTRLVPMAIVVEARVNGFPVRALLDTGSLADFISTKVVDQLKLSREKLEKPLSVQLAVTGSRTSVNESTVVDLKFQGIEEKRRFDVINLESYDMILGTPFFYQHKMAIGFNPSKISIGSNKSLPVHGEEVATIPSRAADVIRGGLERIRLQLKDEARDLFKGVADTPLPPMRAVNHAIPLVDEKKIYHWRPSKCPEAMRPLWNKKRDEYIKSGRWRFAKGTNASPMLILWKPKPGPDGERKIRTVVDKREQNANTIKVASPLPDMEIMLRNAAKARFRSLMDGKDAYEQIRVVPEHVPRTLFTTPDGTMESLVLQQGDCNGGATYQALMNHIFAPYIGVFMYVYLDDILIFSDTIEDHVKHIRIVLDVLRKQKLYLSPDKMNLFASELPLLGHVVDDNGIRMDPHKVDSIANWKTPTNKDLLAGFLGAVGYLANGVAGVRIPMAVLTPLTGSTKTFRWGPTEQRAFDEVKRLVVQHRNVHRVSIDYSKGAPWINLTCDASLTGAGGHVSQGDDIKTAKNVAFWSGKFNSAQQNYPTHERELLAIVESLKRFRHLLMGTKFRIYTDHRALESLHKQKNLSPRQARWLEALCDFDYEVHYLPGDQNVLSDALSRMYSNEDEGTVRAPSEFLTAEADEDMFTRGSAEAPRHHGFTRPLYSGVEQMPELMAAETIADDAPKGKPEPRRSGRLQGSGRPNYNYDRTYSKRTKMSEKAKGKQRAVDIPDEGTFGESSDGRTLEQAETSRPGLDDHGEDERWESLADFPNYGLDENGAQSSKDAQRAADLGARDTPKEVPTQGLSEGDHHKDTPHSTNSDRHDGAPDTMHVDPLPAIVSSSEGIDIYGIISGRYKEDTVFKEIIDQPERYRNFDVDEGLLYITEGKQRLLCVPDIKHKGRRVREILITHAHSILAHLGSRKTSQYLREHVWWKGLNDDVEAYCDSCSVCAMSKSRTTKQYGLLHALRVPHHPWQSMGVDFVGPLPESKNRHGKFDMIAVFIDHLTSMVHLAPCAQTYRAKDIAEMVFDVVYRHHGLPETIVSDRDSYFTSTFWKHLHEMIGTELRMSSAYHPQTDGATERANRTMTQMLRQCVANDQTNWVQKLPGIEFAMNSARSDTTGFSPFFLNYGRTPDPMLWNVSKQYPGVRVFAQRIKDAIQSAHDAIIAARVKQTAGANKHRREAPFTTGDLVYLSTENLSMPKKRARKLVPKFIGPYRILEEITKGASYKLDLPPELKQRGVHPVFHASKLRPHVPNDDRRFPGREIRQLSAFEEEPREWAVDKIITHYGSGHAILFKLKWKTGDETWCDLRTAQNLEALRAYCDLMGVSDAMMLPKGTADLPNDDHLYTGSLLLSPSDGISTEGVSCYPPSDDTHLQPRRRSNFPRTMADQVNNAPPVQQPNAPQPASFETLCKKWTGIAADVVLYDYAKAQRLILKQYDPTIDMGELPPEPAGWKEFMLGAGERRVEQVAFEWANQRQAEQERRQGYSRKGRSRGGGPNGSESSSDDSDSDADWGHHPYTPQQTTQVYGTFNQNQGAGFDQTFPGFLPQGPAFFPAPNPFGFNNGGAMQAQHTGQHPQAVGQLAQAMGPMGQPLQFQQPAFMAQAQQQLHQGPPAAGPQANVFGQFAPQAGPPVQQQAQPHHPAANPQQIAAQANQQAGGHANPGLPPPLFGVNPQMLHANGPPAAQGTPALGLGGLNIQDQVMVSASTLIEPGGRM